MNDLNNYMWRKEILWYKISDPFLRLVAEKYKDEVHWETILKDETSLNEFIRNVKLAELRQKSGLRWLFIEHSKNQFFRLL